MKCEILITDYSNLFADCLPLQGKDGLVLVQLGLQTHVLQLQLLDPHLQRLDICPHAPHPERRISEICLFLS